MPVVCPKCSVPVPEVYEKMCLDRRINFQCPLCHIEVPLRNSTIRQVAHNTLKEWAGANRIVCAIVFTDIVGSTKLIKRIGDEAMSNVLKAHLAKARELIELHQGYFSNDIGDGVLAAFHDVGEALDFTIAFRSNPGDPQIGIRVAIHVGPVEIDGNHIAGKEVHFAARVLQAIGKRAEIWLSQRSKEYIDCLRAQRHQHLEWTSQVQKLPDFGVTTLWSLSK